MVFHRKWQRKIFYACVFMLGFTILWTFTTMLVLVAQENYLASKDMQRQKVALDKDDFYNRGVQVVVGHYNGNLPSEEKKNAKNLSIEIINENDYRPISGFGENGKAVRLNGEDEVRAKDLFQINQFNLVASNRISVNRTLLDARKKACRLKTYIDDERLTDTSVIVVFHNEAFSTLARTVMSVINRSKKILLREIILVDDYSEREFLKEPLEVFASEQQVPVIIVRAQERVGLTRARLLGAAKATGKVLTFLDSHCECTEGWLEPLLSRIAEDRKVAVCPIIDVINDQTFAYSKGIELFRGGFNWNLQFRWYAVPPAEISRRGKDTTMPIASPTMAGGLFAMDREYFFEVGSYDDQMDIWGGENLEMSFRIWQCGGRVEILPCSRVGHVFRKASPHDFASRSSSQVLNANLARVAEVWMGRWKHLFYSTAPQAKKLAKTLNVTGRLALKERLQCRDFQWYLTNVWPDHFMPMEGQFFGRVEHKRSHKCLVSLPGAVNKRQHTLKMQQCSLGFDHWQFWIYTEQKFLRGDEHQCLTAAQVSGSWMVQLKECTETENDKWDYNEYKRHFIHIKSGLCLGRPANLDKADEVHVPSLVVCARDDEDHFWRLSPVDWAVSDEPKDRL